MQKAMCNSSDCKKKGGSLKCILGGLAAGIAVSAVGVVMMNNSTKTLQKKAGKVADAMEDLLNSAKDMFQ
ncbi:MAG: hypothetical protein IJH07_08025 [Ruminococcus sp.]|nr:hypothetical protein [Ruminococcus sp.]